MKREEKKHVLAIIVITTMYTSYIVKSDQSISVLSTLCCNHNKTYIFEVMRAHFNGKITIVITKARPLPSVKLHSSENHTEKNYRYCAPDRHTIHSMFTHISKRTLCVYYTDAYHKHQQFIIINTPSVLCVSMCSSLEYNNIIVEPCAQHRSVENNPDQMLGIIVRPYRNTATRNTPTVGINCVLN